MVPSVAIGDRSSLGDARDLVAIVPPSHDSGVLRRVLVDPLITFQIVIDQDLAPTSVADFVHNLWVRERLRNSLCMPDELRNLLRQRPHGEHVEDKKDRETTSPQDCSAVVVEICARLFILLCSL